MKLTREEIINAARESHSMESLSEILGGDNNAAFWHYVDKICPGFAKLVERNQVFAQVKKLSDAGETSLVKTYRAEGMRLTIELVKLGLGDPSVQPATLLETPAEKDEASEVTDVVEQKCSVESEPIIDTSSVIPVLDNEKLPEPQVSKVKKERPVKAKVISNPVLESVDYSAYKMEFSKDIIKGLIPNEEYLGRKIAVVEIPVGLFGDECPNKTRTKTFTVTNGLINHCDFKVGEIPETYWSTMDAMLDLGTFTKEAVLEKAVKTIIDAGSEKSPEELKSSCDVAFNVLKTHNIHPTKKKVGMTYMCDSIGKNENGEKLITIRGRMSSETLTFFEEAKKSVKLSKESGKPILSVHLKEPV